MSWRSAAGTATAPTTKPALAYGIMSSRDSSIGSDVDALVKVIVVETGLALLDNPYGPLSDSRATTRQNNLRAYLDWAVEARPSVMWLAEAPGVGGITRTGVPMIPEDRFESFRSFTGCQLCRLEGEPVASPATAHWIWEELERAGSMPVLWNAVVHHPHPVGRSDANRRPTITEIDHFTPVLIAVAAAAGVERIVAIGRVAQRAAERVPRVDVEPVRHPAQGGLGEFRRQVRALRVGR